MNGLPQREVQVLEENAKPIAAEAQAIEIKTTEDVESASQFLKKISDNLKVIESKRLEFTAPLNQSLKSINDTFKRVKEPLMKAKEEVSSKILTWRRAEQERIAKEEQRRQAIQKAHEAQGHNVNAPVTMARPENTIGNTQVRKVWTFEITDFSQVPDSYKGIDRVAVNNAIRAGVREVPGLKIYQEETMAIV